VSVGTFAAPCPVAPLAQAGPKEPSRGSALGAARLDVFRFNAAFDLSAAIEFRVLEVPAVGDITFARRMARHPGGAAIERANTLMVLWRQDVPLEFDGPQFEVFFARARDPTVTAIPANGIRSTMG